MKQKELSLKKYFLITLALMAIIFVVLMLRGPSLFNAIKTDIIQRMDRAEEISTNVALKLQSTVEDINTTVRNITADFKLTSSTNVEASNGKGGVDLDWSDYTENNKTFKIYQKKEGALEYETISSLNFSAENMQITKVLNVYPETGAVPTVTFKYKDGTSTNLPKSASLKVWMEGGSITENGVTTTYDAYGINPETKQQLIYVTPVSSTDFNNNPNVVWNYDIVMFGTWDGNGYNEDAQPNDNAINVLEQYIKAGYGILAGHDTIGYAYNGIGLSRLRNYFNIEVGKFGVDFSTVTTPIENIDVQGNWLYYSEKVKVTKKGTITNFPWELQNTAELTVPLTHTCSNAAKGTVWMELTNGYISSESGAIKEYFESGVSNPYYFVTTYNNTAMIQTGHLKCESTEDERKILANTLFYLNQLSSVTSTTDNSAQDLKEPNVSIINIEGVNEDGKISVKYNAKDNGTTYKYYVEAFDKSDSSTVVATSNEVTEVVTTGVKGYYYVLDNNPENDFEIANSNYTETEQILLENTDIGKYLHIKAVDKAGNVGTVATVQIDVDIEMFTVTVKDGDKADILLPNSKFILYEIKMVDGKETLNEPKDIFLEPAGTEETINGKKVRTITTDENGTIQINLKNGYYKIEQIETEEGYIIGENNSEHYFGINTDRGENVELKVEDPFILNKTTSEKNVSTSEFKVEGRTDGTALYYYLGKISFISSDNKIMWTKDSSKVYEMFSDENGFDVLLDNKIVRYDNNGNIEKDFSLVNGMRAWTKDEKGNTIILGEFSNSITISADNMFTGSQTSISSSGSNDLFILVLNSNGKVTKIKKIGTTANETGKNIELMKNGNYVVTYVSDSTYRLMTVDEQNLEIIKDVNVNTNGKTDTTIHDIALNDDGSIYYMGCYDGTITYTEDETVNGKAINLTSTNEDGILVKYTPDLKIEWAKRIGGKYIDHFFDMDISEDNGIIIGGDSQGGGLTFAAEDTQAGYAITTSPVGNGTVKDGWRGITVKINPKGKIVWAREFGFTGNEGCYTVTSFTNDTFALCGFSNSTTGSENGKAMLIRVSEEVIDIEIEAMTSIDIYNYKKQYNITTELKNEGGTISGSEEDIYEKVYYNEDSTKDIIVTSNDGYRIKEIILQKTDDEGKTTSETVEIENDTRTYTLNLKNVKQHIKVIVEFERIEAKVIVHHYFEGTTTPIVDSKGKNIPDKEIEGYVNDSYETTSSSEIAEYYEIAEVPSNNTGIFTEETIEVTYYYKYKTYEYKIEYYYENELNSEKTETLSETYKNTIEQYPNKNIKGYKFDKTVGLPLTIGTKIENNIIKVYYTKRTDIIYTVEYYYENVKDESQTEIFENQTYEALIETYPDKNKTGYKWETDTAPIILDTEGNIIKVYYIIDESQTKELSYTVEYYKENVKSKEDTQTEKETVQILQPNTLTVNKSNINIEDKYIGYKLTEIKLNDEKIEKLPDTVNLEDVIKIYYVIDEKQTKELSYTVEYYKDNVKSEGDTQTEKETVQVLQPNTLTVNKEKIDIKDMYYGYTLSEILVNGKTVAKLPDTVEKDSIIQIKYVIDEKNTKELGYTVEYYKDNVKVENDTQIEKETVQVLQPDTLTVNKTQINIKDKYYGYKLSLIKLNDKTIDNLPETVNTNDIIKIYYVLDEGNTKKLSYTVEYYKGNVKSEEDTQTKEISVQILQPDTLTVDQTQINTKDKYYGYKLSLIKINEKTIDDLPETVNTKDVIKIYYIIDESKTKELNYTVEYYKDNIKSEEDTQTEKETVQILQPDTLTVDQTQINIKDKYYGYKLSEIKVNEKTQDTLPETVNTKDVIRIYYIIDESKTKDLNYTVEYYKSNVKSEEDTQTKEISVQVLQPDTITVDKSQINIKDKYYGYKLSEIKLNDNKIDNLPETVNTKDVIKIYYVVDEENTKEISYTIEYYKEGKLEDSEKVSKTIQVLEKDNLDVDKSKITDKYKYKGYKLVNTDPIEIPEKVKNGEVIKLYYLIDEDQTKELTYTVEYYKENAKSEDDTQTENKKVQILKPDTITVDKSQINIKDKYYGYKLSEIKLNDNKIDSLPETVNTKDVIKIYYVIDESQTKNLSYTVEYYKDTEKVESDTQTVEKAVQVLEPNTITVDKTQINTKDKYKGYVLEKTEPTEIPDSINNGEIIKVYYKVREDIQYTIEYYYDNVKDDNKTEIINNQKYGALIETYPNKNIAGYKWETDTAPIILDVENNIIKVYYIKDTFEYTIEYYYDGIKDTSKTESSRATYKDVINNYLDKNINGYKLSKTENLPLTITEDVNKNIIKIYYIVDDGNTKELSYSVEYYKDNVKVEEDTQVVKNIVQILSPDTLKVDKTQINVIDKYVGYKLEKTEPETIPTTVNTGDVIKVFYVKDEFEYTTEYYYDGIINKNMTESGKAIYETIIDVYTDKNIKGYKLEKTENNPLKITEDKTQNIMKVYYVKDTFEYTVEYYYEGIKDSSKTEVNKQTYNDIINNYTDKNITGYKLEKTENLPLTITEDVNKNIIKIYYIVDDGNTKELSYSVEYYKDNVKVEEDSQIVTNTVQVLKPDTLKVNKADINTVNKYLGYKLEKTEPTVIPSTVNNGDIIKIYYVLDESQTKKLNYTVEYYKDGMKVEEDTTEEKTTVQVLKPNTLTVNKEKINLTDKYVGYKLEKTEPAEISNVINSGDTIKVYYTPRTDITYTVEYYYENRKDESKTEIFENQTFGTLIETYPDKNITGYKWETDTAPIVLGVEENIIKVYYVKDKFEYTVEYYYDGIKDTSKTEVLKDTFENVITTYPDKTPTGYVTEKTEGLPLTISSNAQNNIIKVYYVKGEFEYTVEYYYEGIKDSSKTEVKKAKYGDVISTYTEKAKTGYVIESVDNIPLTIKEIEIDNIIRVYYVKGEFNYTVEYYYEGVKDDSKTVASKGIYNDIVEDYDEKLITGYKLKEVENIPLVITEESSNNIIKVYYEKDEFEYKVEYYYDDEKQEVETEYDKAKFEEVINTYMDKNITGYKLEKTENLPLTISANKSSNVIRIYYVKADFEYTVNYYYDGIEDTSAKQTLKGIYEEIIETYPDKVKYGYEFDSVNGLPLTITEKPEENIIDVYYTRKTGEVEVKYIDKISKREISVETIKTGKVLDSFDLTEDEKEIDGYTLIEKPSSLTGKYEEQKQTYIYYYAVTSDVIIKYLEKGTDEEIAVEDQIIGYEGKEYTTNEKAIEGYTYVETKGNEKGTMTKRTTEVIYYYLQNTTVRVNYIDRETDVILETVVEKGKVGDVYESKAKDFENYVLVDEPVLKTVTMEKEEIVLEYYYAHVSDGVIEKHIDLITGEILDNETYPGNEGDTYKTRSKNFKGYDLVEDRLPSNAEGVMSIGTIEVKYYYIRKTSVIVEYIDVLTGYNIELDGEDTTEIIEGHEGDLYNAQVKTFSEYEIVKDKYPDNSTGRMKVTTDENGKVDTTIRVTFYYVHKSKGVEEQYIDISTGETIGTNLIKGNEGDEYTSTPKEIEGYELVEEKLPDNTEGEMTIEKIEVKYYYIRKMKVIVEYIDTNTTLKLKEINKETQSQEDSTETIEGLEGDSYTTKEKKFDNYKLVNKTDNTEGIMKPENGSSEIRVKYYYAKVSPGVKIKYIDSKTGEIIKEEKQEGYVGDNYTSALEEINGYELVKEKLPANREGTMGDEGIEIKYYYIRKTKVVVEYINRKTGSKLKVDTVIEGHEGDTYSISSEVISGYNLVDKTNNETGTMTKDSIVVKYYYENPNEVVVNKNTSGKTPNTGDMLPVYAISMICVVIILNVTMQVVIIKKRK